MTDRKGTKLSVTGEQTKWQKALVPGSTWEKDDLLEVVYWLRQAFGFFCGILWGLFPLTGFAGLASFGLLNAVVFFLYYSKFLGVDDEDMGRWDLVQEGYMTAVGLFMVNWICCYSFFHGA